MPGDKTEKASFKKRKDERKKGRAFQSQDLTSAAVLLSIFAALKFLGPQVESAMENSVAGMLERIPDIISGPRDVGSFFSSAGGTAVKVLVPIFAASASVAVIVTLAQTRLLVTPANMTPKFERISPVQGFKKLFSLRSIVEMVKSLLKIVAILAIIFMDVYPKLPQVTLLFDTSIAGALGWIAQLAIDVGFKAGAVLLVIGVADYFYQWWDFERSIMMTKHETKEEYKQTEGNPQIKGRIRNLQRKLARMRMMQAVPKADVVIRNPTHFAVALKYDTKTGRAPFVVAKGADAIALRIVALAEKNGVYITENKPLAQALYKSVEIGGEIPAEFYKAVAGVLAYLYTMKRAGRS
ncbi:MAG: flagellar biosynthesis protein FlhB [Clostridia bacterium]|nr:flagellar biosynthesis protein FlhB [Clostridia bacterium]MDR3645356.1 flagellar biosynthesis protein FlhB [Clostridia bacterium]